MLPEEWTVSFDRGLDRRVVHRVSNASVLLTSIRECPSGTWVLGAQIPREGLVGRRRPARGVPLLLGVEVLRQAGLAIAHTGFGVPIGHAFTMQEMSFRWIGRAPDYPNFGPLEAEAHVAVLDVVTRRNQIAGLQLHLTLRVGERKLAETRGTLQCLSPAQYRLFRRTAPLPTEVTPRFDERPLRDIRQSSVALNAHLGWNHDDPFTFDHPTDHLPGMAILQSMISAAQHLAPARTVDGIEVTFRRFVEFTPAPRVHARVLEDGRIETTVTQGDDVAVTGVCDVNG